MYRWAQKIVGLITLIVVMPAVAEDDIDPKVADVMNRMSAYIASLDTWMMTGESSADVRLDNGMLVEQRSTQTVWVDKPNRIRTSDRTETVDLELYLADGQLTIYRDDYNYYGQVEAVGTIEEAMEFALDEYDIEAPLLDFIYENVSKHILDEVQSTAYLGISRIRGETYHHIALQETDVDVQLWISTGDKPLPGRTVITSKWIAGAPRYSTLLDWDPAPEISDKTFLFSPPAGAMQIDVLPQD